jgi:hypothetical protein
MPEKVIKCPKCRRKIRLRWKQSRSSSLHDYNCPYACGAGLQVQATPPIRIYRLDSTGNWELAHTIGS